jgi:peroxiredoxin Q/BCP
MSEEAPAVGSAAPDFRLPSTNGEVALSDLLASGDRVLLAFYNEDGTPMCSTQLGMLVESHDFLREMGVRVVAVSADSLERHASFSERLGGTPFPLGSDSDLAAARAYGVIDEADGRRSRRAVFVIDRDGRLLLALPHFQPGNMSQVEAIFQAVGAET